MQSKFPQITLKAARVNVGYSQKQAAEKLQINTSTLQNYESGKVVPQWDTVKRIEELYGIDIDYIFLGSNTAKSG